MQNSGTSQNAGRNAPAQPMPPGEQMGTNDTQSEFSVNESRRAAAKEENEQRQQNADAGKQEKRMDAQAADPQSEFSVEQRLRDEP